MTTGARLEPVGVLRELGALEMTLDINSPFSSWQTACPMDGGARESEFWPLKHEQPGLGHLSADEAAEKVTRSGRGSPQVAGEASWSNWDRRAGA